jgi:hypothetical protein
MEHYVGLDVSLKLMMRAMLNASLRSLLLICIFRTALAYDRQSQIVQLGPEPCRGCSCLEPDPRDVRRMRFDECRDRFGVGRNHSFTFGCLRRA